MRSPYCTSDDPTNHQGETCPVHESLLGAYKYDGPGKFESVPPIVRFIWERDAFDQTSGDVESPFGWFAHAGRWLIGEDDRGAVAAQRYPDRASARSAFDGMDMAYGLWLESED